MPRASYLEPRLTNLLRSICSSNCAKCLAKGECSSKSWQIQARLLNQLSSYRRNSLPSSQSLMLMISTSYTSNQEVRILEYLQFILMALRQTGLMSMRKVLNNYEKYQNRYDLESMGMEFDEMEVIDRLRVLVLLEIEEYELSLLYLNFSMRQLSLSENIISPSWILLLCFSYQLSTTWFSPGISLQRQSLFALLTSSLRLLPKMRRQSPSLISSTLAWMPAIRNSELVSILLMRAEAPNWSCCRCSVLSLMLMGKMNFFLFLPKTTLVLSLSSLILPLSMKLDRNLAWHLPKRDGMNRFMLKPIMSSLEYPKNSEMASVIFFILPRSSTRSMYIIPCSSATVSPSAFCISLFLSDCCPPNFLSSFSLDLYTSSMRQKTNKARPTVPLSPISQIIFQSLHQILLFISNSFTDSCCTCAIFTVEQVKIYRKEMVWLIADFSQSQSDVMIYSHSMDFMRSSCWFCTLFLQYI